jgi:hypothetical protein
MKEMVIVNFYKKYEANWDELQMMALDTIAKMEETLEDVEIGELSVYQQYEDYRTACMQGLKTFILQVLNDWENMNILVLNGEFYKKFEFLEMEGILNDWEYSSLYRNSKELFTFFNKEKFQLTPEQFDFIHALYSKNDDVICNLLSFEYEVREISEEDDNTDDLID